MHQTATRFALTVDGTTIATFCNPSMAQMAHANACTAYGPTATVALTEHPAEQAPAMTYTRHTITVHLDTDGTVLHAIRSAEAYPVSGLFTLEPTATWSRPDLTKGDGVLTIEAATRAAADRAEQRALAYLAADPSILHTRIWSTSLGWLHQAA